MFGTRTKLSFSLPLEKDDHHELDTSEHLYSDGVQKHQSMICNIKWDVSLRILDASTAVMTLASFRADPRQGHLDHRKRVASYLSKFKHATIRIRTEESDLSSTPTTP